MPKYQIFRHDPPPWYAGQPTTWEVANDEYAVAAQLTEAEAHIIAWALGAVADNYRLGRQKLDGYSDYEEYDGPTEGVAP